MDPRPQRDLGGGGYIKPNQTPPTPKSTLCMHINNPGRKEVKFNCKPPPPSHHTHAFTLRPCWGVSSHGVVSCTKLRGGVSINWCCYGLMQSAFSEGPSQLWGPQAIACSAYPLTTPPAGHVLVYSLWCRQAG